MTKFCIKPDGIINNPASARITFLSNEPPFQNGSTLKIPPCVKKARSAEAHPVSICYSLTLAAGFPRFPNPDILRPTGFEKFIDEMSEIAATYAQHTRT